MQYGGPATPNVDEHPLRLVHTDGQHMQHDSRLQAAKGQGELLGLAAREKNRQEVAGCEISI